MHYPEVYHGRAPEKAEKQKRSILNGYSLLQSRKDPLVNYGMVLTISLVDPTEKIPCLIQLFL